MKPKQDRFDIEIEWKDRKPTSNFVNVDYRFIGNIISIDKIDTNIGFVVNLDSVKIIRFLKYMDVKK
jgi:hypothetical protein